MEINWGTFQLLWFLFPEIWNKKILLSPSVARVMSYIRSSGKAQCSRLNQEQKVFVFFK
jgi:hypothetical protein